MPQVELGSGRLVTFFPEYGPEATIQAAELSEADAPMTLAQSMYFNIATLYVSVKCVQDVKTPGNDDAKLGPVTETVYDSPKSQQEMGGGETGLAMLIAFRKSFTDEEWEQLRDASNQVYAGPKSGKAFKILR